MASNFSRRFPHGEGFELEQQAMSKDRDDLIVRPVTTTHDRKAWLDLPGLLMHHDPNWIEPLRLQERRRISREGNPFFGFGEAEMFVAWRDGQPVGRISAQINRRYLEWQDKAVGHFGFFDCANDQLAANGLVEAASNWLRRRGLSRMEGPLSFTINEEVGLLIDGFDSPPAILMGHSAKWSRGLLEGAGLVKEIDTFAYRVIPSNVPPVIKRLAGLAARSGRISVRPLDMSNYRAEVQTLVDIFNDAWSDNWGFVPFADSEIDALISETRYLIRGKYGRFLLLDGIPIGVMLALPDINDTIKGSRGRLLPTSWARLGVSFLTERWRTARIPLLGIRKSHRGLAMAPAMLALLVAEFIEESRSYPLDWVELSWVLETNRAMTTLAELAAGPPSKTYRVFGCDLA
jgi:hypothetical protein